MLLPIPPRSEQDDILRSVGSRIARENNLLSKNERAVSLLREYRSALITSAVTGQIDVATHGKAGTTDRRLDEIEEAMGA